MDMQAEIGILLAYAIGILLLYVLGYMFLVPIKLIVRLIINSVLGGITILAINWIGGCFGFHLALNFISAAIVGLLGVPGILLWVLLTAIPF
ncbi:pro-sigmaK processing inhibitor BofA family protein [Sinanaerobacter sp. ZZT-01]|uniref:pro-sigmaK processing inhibitor BofA family protein n=1 Tax=Sinanaerobacter sp. ZZT-01 TaxID=3111540 RepID=UPI002D78FDBC|nr:pro-sigmaK processing inhibitor BofA family protein [Sinanaerobacter sp. ZZT-01]WRR92190.1 pro-sigmaK processing inhibitor BofA family protein [Sinanaerobacter sp. ZZT-01]